MPEAVKEGGVAEDVAVPPEDTVPPPPVDLATDGVIEVKPPPDTEPSLPADHKQNVEADEKMVETAPDVKEPPIVIDKTDSMPTTEALNETKAAEPSPKEELDEMILKGRGLLTIKRDCYAAAEVLSKACEKSSEIYGELSEHCGELYYLYGCSMLECGKSENNVLGEGMKNKESEEEVVGDDDEEEEEAEAGDDNGKDEKCEAMEVDECEEGASSSVGTSNGAVVKEDKDEGDDTTKDEDDDDSSLKVAWEMFELAKVAYSRSNHKEKLADTFMKLGEVGIESGHPAAMEDMLKALDIRQQLFPNSRLIAETHFNIGLGYSMFEMFDEAITNFEKSKSLLEEIIVKLENAGDDKSLKESEEIRGVLPDLKDKIQDMVDSKRDKRKEVEEALNGSILAAAKQNGPSSAGTSSESDKPASNISHLIKRKRKIDEVTSDLPSKAIEEPKRKVKALDKEAIEEQHSEIDAAAEQKKNSGHLESSSQEEPMEMEEVKTTDCTENSAEDHSQPLNLQESQSKTESKTGDSESVVIKNSIDCESTETDKEVPVKVECEQNLEKLSENEEKKVDDSAHVEEKEIKSESAAKIASESSHSVSTEENAQSTITDVAAQDEIKKPLPQLGGKNEKDLSANADEQKCTNEKNLSEQVHKESLSIENSGNAKSIIQATTDVPEPSSSKEPSLKENSEIKISDVLEETVVKEPSIKENNETEISSVSTHSADEKTKTEVPQIQTGTEKAVSDTESNQAMKESVNVRSTTDTNTPRNIESEQVEVTMEVVESQMTELQTKTTDTVAATDSTANAKVDTKTDADLSQSGKRETIESSDKEISTEIVRKQPCLDNMEVESTTKDTTNESKEIGSETNATVTEHEAMEATISSSAHEEMETTCEIPDSQAKNETTNLPSSNEEAVVQSEDAVDESEMKSLTKSADVKAELQPPKVTAVATLNETLDQPAELKEMEAPSKTSECIVQELATETSERKETASLNIESKPNEKEASSSTKSVEDENVNGTEESLSLSTVSSKISLEENSVTNGCKEDHPVEEVTSNVETPLVAKEFGKEEITSTVAAE